MVSQPEAKYGIGSAIGPGLVCETCPWATCRIEESDACWAPPVGGDYTVGSGRVRSGLGSDRS